MAQYSATVEKQEKSTVHIKATVPSDVVSSYRKKAIQTLNNEMTLDGFRKGHIPEKVLVERLGDMAIYTEAAEHAIRAIYPLIIKEHAIDAIGAPSIAITKVAPLNPLEFTATVAVVPEITLPDYKKIAASKNKEKEDTMVTDTEVTEAIERLLRQKMAYERLQEKAKQAKAETGSPESKETDEKGLSLPTPETADSEEDYAKLPLPELTDEYVKTLGNFTTVEDFKTQLRTHLASEKEREILAKNRAAITDEIVEKTKLELPQVLIDSELAQIFHEMESDIARANLKLDDYLAHMKKTRDDLKKEWTPIAEKRAKLQLVLNEIAKKENVTPDDHAVEHEVHHLLEHYKDADHDRVKIYIESVMRNEAVMKMLESIA